MSITIIVASPPEYASAAARPNCAVAHMAYRIGRGFRLYRSQRAGNAKDGFMVLDISGWTGGGPLTSLVDDIMRECLQRNFGGIVINIGSDPHPKSVLLTLLKALASATQSRGFLYFVPESLCDSGENAIVRISASISGGTLERRIADSCNKYGSGRIALEIDRIRMDFTLPSPRGVGRETSDDELRNLIHRHNPATFFSPELMVNYFMYQNNNDAHFVLYDDAESLRQKIVTAANSGIKHAFLFYPRVMDVYDEVVT